jgi:LytS/YehU family sensor histidine kinase
MAMANSGIKFIFKSMVDERRMIALEGQSLQAEMEALKYQINPHFFMNTLNNIHALIDIDSEAAKTTVIELSKMMRYVLYDSENQVTDLVNDVNFVEHYIALMRIRYTDDVDIRLDVQNPLPVGVKVPPLLLIVFVENAFKHGVSYTQPSHVYMSLSCHDGKTHFQVRNSRHPSVDAPRGGVGLENVRKRLDLIYDGNYSLSIDDNADEYVVNLSIPVMR